MLKRIIPLILIMATVPYSLASTVTSLVLKGPVKIQIGPGKTTKHNKSVTMSTRNGVLEISMTDSTRKGWYDVSLSARTLKQLKKISIYDSASLTSRVGHFRNLTIQSSSSGMVDFIGDVSVKNITQNGRGKIRIHKLMTHDLDVKSSGGSIILAGHTDHLRIHASNNADVNARHLEAKDVWVHTDDESFVKVNPQRAFYAFSHDISAIESYNKPRYRSILPYERSAILYPKQKLRTYHYRRPYKLKL